MGKLSLCKVSLQAPSSGHSRDLALERPCRGCVHWLPHRNVSSAASIQDPVHRLPDCSAPNCPTVGRRVSLVGWTRDRPHAIRITHMALSLSPVSRQPCRLQVPSSSPPPPRHPRIRGIERELAA